MGKLYSMLTPNMLIYIVERAFRLGVYSGYRSRRWWYCIISFIEKRFCGLYSWWSSAGERAIYIEKKLCVIRHRTDDGRENLAVQCALLRMENIKQSLPCWQGCVGYERIEKMTPYAAASERANRGWSRTSDTYSRTKTRQVWVDRRIRKLPRSDARRNMDAIPHVAGRIKTLKAKGGSLKVHWCLNRFALLCVICSTKRCP